MYQYPRIDSFISAYCAKKSIPRDGDDRPGQVMPVLLVDIRSVSSIPCLWYDVYTCTPPHVTTRAPRLVRFRKFLGCYAVCIQEYPGRFADAL